MSETFQDRVTALEAAVLQPITGSINTIGGTAYTLQPSDIDCIVRFTSDVPVTLTVPPGLIVGFSCGIIQRGLGQVSLLAGAGVVISNSQGYGATSGQFAYCSLIQDGPNAFIFAGDGA